MPENVYDQPQELLRFVSDEHHQFLIAISNERDELKAVNNLQGLYEAALSHVKLTDKADLIALQEAFFRRQKPFDKLIRHSRNFMKENRLLAKLPHPLIPFLIEMHDTCSRFASHADIDTFVHRAREFHDAISANATVLFFQPHAGILQHFRGLQQFSCR